MKHSLCLLISVLMLLFPLSSMMSQLAYASEPEQGRTIRVGFPDQPGLTEIDENGNYSGYNYDYLMEIGKITGWDFTFVRIPGTLDHSIGTMLEMLDNGELDLMGSMAYSEELTDHYGYPSTSCGMAHTVLKTLEENTALNENNYSTYPMRVAAYKGAKTLLTELDTFARSMGMNYTVVLCDDDPDMIAALREGKADTMLTRDVALMEGTRTLVKFAPRPFYFVTSKEDTELLRELDKALIRINEMDPDFTSHLYETYFGDPIVALAFSEEERQWLKKTDPLRVGVDLGNAPLQSRDDRNGEYWGISFDVLDLISKETGLAFEIVPVQSREELYEKLQTGEVDIGAGIIKNESFVEKNHMVHTRSYLKTQVVMAVSNQVNPEEIVGKRLAVAKGLQYEGPFMGEVQWFDTPEQAFQAIRDGRADYMYGNNYFVEYYSKKFYLQNRITLVPQSGLGQEVCFGLSSHYDPMLLTILNKTILRIPFDQIQQIALLNSTKFYEPSILDFFYANPVQAFVLLSAVSIMVIGLLLLYARTRIAAIRRDALANERYRQLSELSGEYLFEYDFRRDLLELSEECARYFGGIRIKERYQEQILKEHSPYQEWFLQTNQDVGSFEMPCFSPIHGSRWFRIIYKKIYDAAEKPAYIVGKLIDVHEEHEEKERLQSEATRDGLTGILNAAASRSRIEKSCAPGGVLFLFDVDFFKGINDQYGHYNGDAVLIRIAEALRTTFDETAVIGRWGGDEFVAYLPESGGAEQVKAMCEKINRTVAALQFEGTGISATVSIGAAVCETAGYETLYKAADDALYCTKREQRGSYRIVSC